MQIPFPFESMLVFGSLAIMLLLGVLARAKISFFQNFLIPSCLIGGIVGVVRLERQVVGIPVLDGVFIGKRQETGYFIVHRETDHQDRSLGG